MMTVLFSTDFNPVGTAVASISNHEVSGTVVEEAYFLVILYACHRRADIELLWEMGEQYCSAGHLCIHFIMLRNKSSIKQDVAKISAK